MNNYIPHKILVINESVEKESEDVIFMECMRLAFQWANDMGLQGKKVFGLHLQSPDPNSNFPFNRQKSLWCKVMCTQEERGFWDEIKSLNMPCSCENDYCTECKNEKVACVCL